MCAMGGGLDFVKGLLGKDYGHAVIDNAEPMLTGTPEKHEALELIEGLRNSSSPDKYMQNIMDGEPSKAKAIAVSLVNNDRGDMELQQETLDAMDKYLQDEQVRSLLGHAMNDMVTDTFKAKIGL